MLSVHLGREMRATLRINVRGAVIAYWYVKPKLS